MSWLEKSLTKLESSLRALIERDSTYEGISRKFHNQLMHALVLAMQAAMQKVPRGDEPEAFVYTAPDKYILLMPAEQAKILLNHPSELDRLAQNLARTAVQANIQLASTPIIRVVASPNAEEVSVIAESKPSKMGESSTTELEELLTSEKPPAYLDLPKAFLIVNGLTTYPIVQAVTNIGREAGNQLILDNPGVSRRHAQLRIVNHRFTIFDLASKGGTFVNGVPVSSQVLNPGDVIQLAGVPLVYGQETAAEMGYTQELQRAQPRPEVL